MLQWCGVLPVEVDDLHGFVCMSRRTGTQGSTCSGYSRMHPPAAARTGGRSPAAAPETRRQCGRLASRKATPARGS